MAPRDGCEARAVGSDQACGGAFGLKGRRAFKSFQENEGAADLQWAEMPEARSAGPWKADFLEGFAERVAFLKGFGGGWHPSGPG